MATSVKESIESNIKTVLETVTIANGYQVDILEVTRSDGNPFSHSDFIFAQINFEGEDKQDGVPMGHSTSTARYTIWCWHTDFDTFEKALNDILADVEKALHLDLFRGGFAQDTDVTGSEVFSAEETSPLHGVAISVEVLYRHKVGNPYSN